MTDFLKFNQINFEKIVMYLNSITMAYQYEISTLFLNFCFYINVYLGQKCSESGLRLWSTL